jgi:hypothetical protein
MRGEGADGPVIAMKPGNAGGAKGSDNRARAAANPKGEEPMAEAQPYDVPKQVVWDAVGLDWKSRIRRESHVRLCVQQRLARSVGASPTEAKSQRPRSLSGREERNR